MPPALLDCCTTHPSCCWAWMSLAATLAGTDACSSMARVTSLAAGRKQEMLYHAPFVLPWMDDTGGSEAQPATFVAMESKRTSAPPGWPGSRV